MEKINLAEWNQSFGTNEQRIVFASERYTDLHFRFEEPGLASGFIKSVSTPGMRLTEFCLNVDQPFCMVEQEANETAESAFVLKGASESSFHNLSSPITFQKKHHNFQYNHQFGGEHIISAPGFHALTITYNVPILKQLLENDENESIAELAQCIHSGKTYLATTEALSCTGRITEALAGIQQCPFSGVTRYLFLESKMMELFALQMEQVQTINECGDDTAWSSSDKEKLHALYEYIENKYLEEFSLKDLIYRFGLNEFKLKKGYKQLFQTTVFGHVHQLRMQKAKSLLQENLMNVTEASFFIGYNNVSSFCTEFKKRFGYSPGKINVSSN